MWFTIISKAIIKAFRKFFFISQSPCSIRNNLKKTLSSEANSACTFPKFHFFKRFLEHYGNATAYESSDDSHANDPIDPIIFSWYLNDEWCQNGSICNPLCYETCFNTESIHQGVYYISKDCIFYVEFKSAIRNIERVKPYTLPDKKNTKIDKYMTCLAFSI